MIASGDPTGAERNCRGGVAFGRFGQNISLRKSGQQFTDGRFLFDICQDENAFVRDQALESRHGFLEQRSVGNETKQLFRPGPATQRPETFAASAGEDQCIDRI